MSAHVSSWRPRQGDLLPFLLLSLLLHALLLVWLSIEPMTLTEENEPPPIVVQLDSPPPPPTDAEGLTAQQQPMAALDKTKQIVAPSDKENELAPDGPAYLSDRDNRVEKESVRKGNPDAGSQSAEESAEVSPEPVPAPPPEPQAEAEPEPAPEPAPEPQPEPEVEADTAPRAVPIPNAKIAKPLPGLDRLFAPPAEVLARARTRDPQEARPATKPAPELDPRRDLMAAPPPVPGVLGGLRGTFDALPDVAPGALTMLNTKADRFAPFVRRVGTRVFQNLLIYQRRDLQAPDILSATQLVTVRAKLDPSGKLKSLEVVDRSGSPGMDRTLVEALRQAAFDPNPPPGASNVDGDFEFIFQAQILANVQPGVNQRIRAVESRLRIGLM